MRKALMVLGGLFAVLLGLGVLAFGYGVVKGVRAYGESQAYIESKVSPLLADYTADSFLDLMDPKERAHLKRADMDAFAAKLATEYGAFYSFDDLKGNVTFLSDGNTHAKFVGRCNFEKGSLPITITVKKSGEAWTLVGIRFDFSGAEPSSSDAAVRADAAPKVHEAASAKGGSEYPRLFQTARFLRPH